MNETHIFIVAKSNLLVLNNSFHKVALRNILKSVLNQLLKDVPLLLLHLLQELEQGLLLLPHCLYMGDEPGLLKGVVNGEVLVEETSQVADQVELIGTCVEVYKA